MQDTIIHPEHKNVSFQKHCSDWFVIFISFPSKINFPKWLHFDDEQNDFSFPLETVEKKVCVLNRASPHPHVPLEARKASGLSMA